MTLFKLIKTEAKAIFSNSAILLTVFGGVIFYSFLYPSPYAHQVPSDQAVTVVNLDNSLTSHQLERMIDATQQIKIVHRAHSMSEAKKQFFSGAVRAIILIPENFSRDLLLSKSPTIGYAGDASYFLIYGTIGEGLTQASSALAAKVKVTQLLLEGVPLNVAKEQYSQVKLNMKPTFNPTSGYVNYVVPAVFMLILQQTLIIGLGLVGVSEKSNSPYCYKQPTYKILCIRTLIFVAIYYLIALYYLGFSFDLYGINTLASPLALLALLAPFLLTSSFIGICLGTLLPRRELVTLVVLLSSMPLIFSTGFIWPLEAVPSPIIWLSNLLPCTPAIQAFLTVNQMGADFSQIIEQWQLLWLQAVIWGMLAYATYTQVPAKQAKLKL